MKWRNQLIALFCLIVFLGFGVLYFRYWVVQKPFGIILFIAEGLDAQTLAAARMHAGGPATPLAIDSLPYTALLKNYSADSPVPDPAAAATAIATGRKVKNGVVAVDGEGHPLTALLVLAQDAGRVTGLITDGRLTAPTVASFYGHAQNKDEWETFARQLLQSSEIDLVLGRGRADFLPKSKGGGRTDEKDLLSAARDAGYDYVQSLAELDAIPRWRRVRLLGLFAENPASTPAEMKDSPENPKLVDMVRRGIELLQYHRGGYLLVVDVASMRRAREAGDEEQALAAALELDRAIGVAKEYTGEKSAILVCSDVADARGAQTPKPTGAGDTQLAFAISPNLWLPPDNAKNETEDFSVIPLFAGDSPAPSSSPKQTPRPSPEPKRPVEDVVALGKGLGADALHGTRENTVIFEIIRDNL